MHLKFTRQFDQMDCGPSCIRIVASATIYSHILDEVGVAVIRKCLGEIGMHHLHHKRSISENQSQRYFVD
jgi:hypothetical protein